jgi:hypothetical protein
MRAECTDIGFAQLIFEIDLTIRLSGLIGQAVTLT